MLMLSPRLNTRIFLRDFQCGHWTSPGTSQSAADGACWMHVGKHLTVGADEDSMSCHAHVRLKIAHGIAVIIYHPKTKEIESSNHGRRVHVLPNDSCSIWHRSSFLS